MRTVCIVQARMGSKRLPGKVLLPLNGHTVIGEVLTRCKSIPSVDEVVCAVGSPAAELVSAFEAIKYDRLAMEAGKYARVYRGNEHDVLARYYGAACDLDLDLNDIVVRVTGDCPLICPEICEEVIQLIEATGADYASNIEPRTFPQGYDCEAFTMRTLCMAAGWSGVDEHVTTWMRSSPGVKRVHLTAPWKMEGRLTLDTEEDYRTICAYFGHAPYEHLQAA